MSRFERTVAFILIFVMFFFSVIAVGAESGVSINFDVGTVLPIATNLP